MAGIGLGMARIRNGEGVLAYEEDNTLRSVDGGSATQLFPALAGVGNRERNSLPSKPNNRIPPKKKNKFGRTKIGKNKKSPVAQVNTINMSNATPLRPQIPMSDEDDPSAAVAVQELLVTQLLRNSRYIFQKK